MKKTMAAVATALTLTSPAAAQDTNVAFLDPAKPTVKGSSVSEFVWAIQQLKEVCENANPDSKVMQVFCAEASDAIYNNFGDDVPEDECFDPRDIELNAPTIPECGMKQAQKIADDLSAVFFDNLKGVGDNNGVPCDFDKKYVCYKLDGQVFAAPRPPA